jgi:GntR family transcriptional repressor for pyruvate dehydrogenase complex
MDDSGLKPVSRVRIFEQAVGQIRTAILSGQYQPGTRLPTEANLSLLLGIGRSTVREAIRVLESEGMVEVRRGAGTFVAGKPPLAATRGEVLRWLSMREETVIQILEVRLGIEWLTVSLAAKNGTSELVQKLTGIIENQWEETRSSGGEPDVDRLADLDIQFHVAISQASRNAIAHEIVTQILPAFSDANRAILWVGKRIEQSIREHEAILKGIARHSSSQAEKAMRGHIERVKDEICAYLQEDCKGSASRNGA